MGDAGKGYVRPLVWEGDGHWHSGDNEGWLEEANTPFGWGYSIEFGRSDEGAFIVDSTFGKRLTGFETPDEAKVAAQADYATRILSAIDLDAIRHEARNEALSGWQPIETAPRDGTPVDLWGINHLHYAKRGERLTNIKFGTVTDWFGRAREDWQTGRGEDFEPTHWMPLPEPPAMIEDKP